MVPDQNGGYNIRRNNQGYSTNVTSDQVYGLEKDNFMQKLLDDNTVSMSEFGGSILGPNDSDFEQVTPIDAHMWHMIVEGHVSKSHSEDNLTEGLLANNERISGSLIHLRALRKSVDSAEKLESVAE